jgi:hypothetical protein
MWWLDDIIVPVVLILGVSCFVLLVRSSSGGRSARPLAPPKICIPSTATRSESNGSTPRSTAASGETTRAAGARDYPASSAQYGQAFWHVNGTKPPLVRRDW